MKIFNKINCFLPDVLTAHKQINLIEEGKEFTLWYREYKKQVFCIRDFWADQHSSYQFRHVGSLLSISDHDGYGAIGTWRNFVRFIKQMLDIL